MSKDYSITFRKVNILRDCQNSESCKWLWNHHIDHLAGLKPLRGNSLEVQGLLRPMSSNALGTSSIPDQGTKISHASYPKTKQNKNNIATNSIRTYKKNLRKNRKRHLVPMMPVDKVKWGQRFDYKLLIRCNSVDRRSYSVRDKNVIGAVARKNGRRIVRGSK